MMKALVNTHCNDQSSAVLTHQDVRTRILSLKYVHYPKVDTKINEKQYSYWI